MRYRTIGKTGVEISEIGFGREQRGVDGQGFARGSS
jgi:aryl-alcohol dehydrogenase-like predicted oxidoreductase